MRTLVIIISTAVVSSMLTLTVARQTTMGMDFADKSDLCKSSGGTWAGRDLGPEVQVTGGICVWGERA